MSDESSSHDAYRAVSEYGIYRRRHPDNGCTGWEVTIGRDGQLVGNKYFGDRSYGGADAALAAAMAHRDTVLKDFPPTPRVIIQQRLTSKNTSGFPGVRAVRAKGELRGFAAETTIANQAFSKFFSIRAHGGELSAFELAKAERMRQLRRADGMALRSEQAKEKLAGVTVDIPLAALQPRSKTVRTVIRQRPQPTDALSSGNADTDPSIAFSTAIVGQSTGIV